MKHAACTRIYDFFIFLPIYIVQDKNVQHVTPKANPSHLRRSWPILRTVEVSVQSPDLIVRPLLLIE